MATDSLGRFSDVRAVPAILRMMNERKDLGEWAYEAAAQSIGSIRCRRRLNRGVECWNHWRQRRGAGVWAFLPRIDLNERQLVEIDLRAAHVAGASLKSACLDRSDLSGADLFGCDASGATLRGANLAKAELGRSKLDDACLAGATLREAKLGEASLRGTDLRGADLTGAEGLTAGQLSHAQMDEWTRVDPQLETDLRTTGDASRPRLK